VWGNDPEEAARYASRLECGTAWVNQHGALHPMAPFGGVKCSGIGVEFNVDGLKEYTTSRSSICPLIHAELSKQLGGDSRCDKKLVAWNHRYLELFDYPSDLV